MQRGRDGQSAPLPQRCVVLFGLMPTSGHRWLIAADWLEEQGAEVEAAAFRDGIWGLAPIETDNGDGDGEGYGGGHSPGVGGDNDSGADARYQDHIPARGWPQGAGDGLGGGGWVGRDDAGYGDSWGYGSGLGNGSGNGRGLG